MLDLTRGVPMEQQRCPSRCIGDATRNVLSVRGRATLKVVDQEVIRGTNGKIHGGMADTPRSQCGRAQASSHTAERSVLRLAPSRPAREGVHRRHRQEGDCHPTGDLSHTTSAVRIVH